MPRCTSPLGKESKLNFSLGPCCLESPEQNEEREAEGVGTEVPEGTLARKWELEGHQFWHHLPGGRIVGEEATVPGGVGAGEMGTDRFVRVWGRSCWTSLPAASPHHLLIT